MECIVGGLYLPPTPSPTVFKRKNGSFGQVWQRLLFCTGHLRLAAKLGGIRPQPGWLGILLQETAYTVNQGYGEGF